MSHCVIGARGEVGRCVSDFLRGWKEEVFEVDVDCKVPKRDIDIMHVCIPYSESFVEAIKDYTKMYNPACIIVYSTVPPGTTRQLGENAVHSPIEGRHPDLLIYFKTFTRFIGGTFAKQIAGFFTNRGLETKAFSHPEITELGKLFSTTRYGINLMFAQEEKDICDKLNLKYEDVVLEYQKMYNEGYAKANEKQFTQTLLTPPGKAIGGHCVIPNAKILNDSQKGVLSGMLADFNGAKEEEPLWNRRTIKIK